MPGERFNVRLLPEEGSGAGDRVVAEIGLEGFNIFDSSGNRTLRKYPLHHISRWSMRGTSLILFTRSPVDVEDRSVTLQGDENTIRSVLDTLTCSCMQMAEMLQSGQDPAGGGQVAANSLNALLKKSKKPALLTADQVEFWQHPEKAGWMHSQGEHIKTWRKRWFVLKQGFLFRFSSPDINAASKPRGIVDLSTVTDVADGGATTGRPNSVKLSTATGHICYLCENETSQVEWYSALEGAVAKIIKLVAGVEDEEPHAAAGGGGSSSAAKAKSWAEQLERTYASVGSTSGSRRGGDGGGGGGSGFDRPSASSKNQMVSIVNYETPGAATGAAGGGGGGAGRYGGGRGRAGGYGGSSGGGGSSDYGYVTVDYGSIAGANTVPDSSPAGGYGGGGAPAGGYGGGSSYGSGSGAGYPAAANGGGDAGYGGGYGSYGQQQQPAMQQQPQQQPAAAYAYPQQQQQQQPMQQQVAPDYGLQSGGGYGSGNLMDAVTAAGQQVQSGSPWQVHYTGEGRPYFFNALTGVTQWNAPA